MFHLSLIFSTFIFSLADISRALPVLKFVDVEMSVAPAFQKVGVQKLILGFQLES